MEFLKNLFAPVNDALSGALDRFDVIIGTIPAPVLTEPLLALVRKDALLLDIRDAPELDTNNDV